MRMLLVARDGRARERFLEELSELGAECDVAAGPQALTEAVRRNRYSGMLFDVPTILRDKRFDKKLLQDLAEVFPSVKIKHDPATDTVYALGTKAVLTAQGGLSVFVEACREFAPRSFRRGDRVEAHLPVTLWRGAMLSGQAGERTTTLNMSFWGCFVFSTAAWTIDEPLLVGFPDLEAAQVRSRVAWIEPWGGRTLPGLGLAFLEMPESLGRELVRLGCDPTRAPVAPPGKEP